MEDNSRILVPWISQITGLEILELEGNTVDATLGFIIDGSYKTDYCADAPSVFKQLKLLIVDSYHGDGGSIALFVSTFSPPKVALRGCTRITREVQASIAKFSSLVP